MTWKSIIRKHALVLLFVVLAVLIAGNCNKLWAQEASKQETSKVAEPEGPRQGETIAQYIARRVEEEKVARKSDPHEIEVQKKSLQILEKKIKDTAWREIQKEDSPETAEARKELQKSADRAKAHEKLLKQTEELAGVIGCEKDSVKVSHLVEETGVGAKMNVIVTNNSGSSIFITTGEGGPPQVQNLCSGGTMTMHFVLKSPENYTTPVLYMLLVASGVREDGTPFSATLPFSLTNYNNSYMGGYTTQYENRVALWEIR